MRKIALAISCLAVTSAIALAQGAPPQAPPPPTGQKAPPPGAKPPQPTAKTKVPVKAQPQPPGPVTACDMLKGRAYLTMMMTSLAGSVSPGHVRFERKGGVKGHYWTQQSSANASNAPQLVQIVRAECKALAPNKANVQYHTTGGAAGNHNLTISDGGARVWSESTNANPPQSGWMLQLK